MSFKKIDAAPWAVIDFLQGKNSSHLVNLSTTTIMASAPFDKGRSVMKLTLIELQGVLGIYSGINKPVGLQFNNLFLLQDI